MEVRGRAHCLVVGAVRVSMVTTGHCPEINVNIISCHLSKDLFSLLVAHTPMLFSGSVLEEPSPLLRHHTPGKQGSPTQSPSSSPQSGHSNFLSPSSVSAGISFKSLVAVCLLPPFLFIHTWCLFTAYLPWRIWWHCFREKEESTSWSPNASQLLLDLRHNRKSSYLLQIKWFPGAEMSLGDGQQKGSFQGKLCPNMMVV